MAVLTRSLREAAELYDSLAGQFDDLHLIDGSMTEYQGGLSVLPVYLSKGLEFDAVILADADSGHYGEAAWDAKLMYVGCTRALHELWLLHDGSCRLMYSCLEKRQSPAGLNHSSATIKSGPPVINRAVHFLYSIG